MTAFLMFLAAHLPVLLMAGGYPCCCGPVLSVSSSRFPVANCPCCGITSYDADAYAVPPGGEGGPRQWKVTGTVGGLCLGVSCSNFGGTHYLDYIPPGGGGYGCLWRSPPVTGCGSGTPNFAWSLTLIESSNCVANPLTSTGIYLQHVNIGASVLANYNGGAGITATCAELMTLTKSTVDLLCSYPATVTLEPVYT